LISRVQDSTDSNEKEGFLLKKMEDFQHRKFSSDNSHQSDINNNNIINQRNEKKIAKNKKNFERKNNSEAFNQSVIVNDFSHKLISSIDPYSINKEKLSFDENNDYVETIQKQKKQMNSPEKLIDKYNKLLKKKSKSGLKLIHVKINSEDFYKNCLTTQNIKKKSLFNDNCHMNMLLNPIDNLLNQKPENEECEGELFENKNIAFNYNTPVKRYITDKNINLVETVVTLPKTLKNKGNYKSGNCKKVLNSILYESLTPNKQPLTSRNSGVKTEKIFIEIKDKN